MKIFIATVNTLTSTCLSVPPADGGLGAVLPALAGDLRQSDGTDPDADRGKAP